MIRSIASLIERQIQKARLQGQLEGLKGEGEPLPERPEEQVVSPGDAAGYRIMAEAGVLPQEIEIKKQILALRERFKAETDEDARKSLMADLAALELRHAIAMEARRRFMKD